MSDDGDGAGDGDGFGDGDDAGTGGEASDPRDLLRDLVEIPSVSSNERACAERLAAYLRSQGREAWIDDVGNVRAPGDDSLLLTSHVDTVPGDVDVRIEADENGDPALWGRGSVDAKGSLAAMAVAAARTGASFVGVVGEETDSRGARHLVRARAAPDAVVNGEPSGWDGITLGYRGFLAGSYRVETEARHSSRPEPNALQRAMAWWGRVENAFEATGGGDENDDGGHANGDEPPVFETVTPKPVSMSGGPTGDGHEVRALVDFEVRVPPRLDLADARETVESVVDGGSVTWHDDRAVPPLMASARSSLAAAFRRAIRAEGGDVRMLRKTGTADANHYAAAWDCPVVTYGPGDSDLDHAPDEHLPLAEFDRAIAVLESVASDVTGG